MSWTVRGSSNGEGEIFRTRPDQPWDPPSFLYNAYRVSFPGIKRSGSEVDHPPPLAPRLKKEYRYTTPPLGLHGLFWGWNLPLLDWGEWSNSRTVRFTCGKGPRYPMNRWLCRHHSRPARSWKWKQSVACTWIRKTDNSACSLVLIPITIYRLLLYVRRLHCF